MNEDDIFHKSTAGPTVYPITAVHWAFLAFFFPPEWRLTPSNAHGQWLHLRS